MSALFLASIILSTAFARAEASQVCGNAVEIVNLAQKRLDQAFSKGDEGLALAKRALTTGNVLSFGESNSFYDATNQFDDGLDATLDAFKDLSAVFSASGSDLKENILKLKVGVFLEKHQPVIKKFHVYTMLHLSKAGPCIMEKNAAECQTKSLLPTYFGEEKSEPYSAFKTLIRPILPELSGIVQEQCSK